MAIAVGIVLGALALLHVYWGIAGVSGRSVALPESAGKPVFQPSRLATFAVAAALSTATFLILARGPLAGSIPEPWSSIGAAGVGAVLTLRAIGDFRWVGFFKRVRGTRFARWDSLLYSPLCLALGLASLWLGLAGRG